MTRAVKPTNTEAAVKFLESIRTTSLFFHACPRCHTATVVKNRLDKRLDYDCGCSNCGLFYTPAVKRVFDYQFMYDRFLELQAEDNVARDELLKELYELHLIENRPPRLKEKAVEPHRPVTAHRRRLAFCVWGCK